MSPFQTTRPTRLSIFVIEQYTGNPMARVPLYAEVAVPKIIPEPPPELRLVEQIRSVVTDIDPSISDDLRDFVEATTEQVLAEVIDQPSRDALAANYARARELLQRTLAETLNRSRREHFGDINRADLKRLMVAELEREAEHFQLGLVPEPENTGILWANPLGVLTTDHVGYVSFDLTRLHPDVYQKLGDAIEMRRSDPNAVLDLSIWVYPYGHQGRFDALDQARFAYDAVVARLLVQPTALPPAIANMGPNALQNPGLTDWRLSPASFAASPKALLGENGCEELVPSNLALQQFVLRQVVRLIDPPEGFVVPEGYKAAYVDDYKVSWYSIGHSLGEILYSLPLAPGESVKLAVIDWSWDSLAKRDEQTKLTEEVLHQTHRDRTITETVKAGLKELQHGSSFMGGTATSAGATGSYGTGAMGLGAAIGNAWSLGGSTATSDGSRDLTAENVQRLSDSFAQASSAQREINSTVVVQARQEEKESIQTRTFTNYNHSHTLTVLYYEVLRHYRVTVEWVRRRRAVLVRIPTNLTTFDASTIANYRFLLEDALLDSALKPAFDLLDKQEAVREEQTLLGIAPNNASVVPFWEGDIDFTVFEFQIKTVDDDSKEFITADKVVLFAVKPDGTMLKLQYIYVGPHFPEQFDGYDSGPDNINSGGRFDAVTGIQHFFVQPEGGQHIAWHDIAGFQFEKWGNNDWRIIQLGINGFDKNGTVIDLLHGPDGKLAGIYHEFVNTEPNSQAVTFIRRPGPRSGPLPPTNRTPEASLAPEEYHQVNKLLNHFAQHKDYYTRIIQLNTDPNTIALQFESQVWQGGEKLIDHADPYPLEVFGSYVAYPLARQASVDDALVLDLAAALYGDDPVRKQWAISQIDSFPAAKRQDVEERLILAAAKSERLITLPTRGVFAEGKLGHCNISEEIDNTRFWKWEEHPIPFEAPGINPITAVTPQPQQTNIAPTPFPQSLVNIVNPSPAPDPTGLTAALNILATPNIFRDMSGRQEVADLLKDLSDNTIKIAEAANRAREIQAKYGAQLDKQEKDLALGQTEAGADVARAMIQQRREESQQVKPNEAQDAIKLSESEMRKGNKTPEEHKAYSKQVQENVKGASPKKKSKPNITLQINLEGYGPRRLVGRFGTTVKQKGNDVGFLNATDFSDLGYLKVGVLNDYDDNRYDVVVEGEVLAGVGINAMLKGGNTVVIPRADFDLYDYFYLKAVAQTDSFDYETKKSDEVTKEVASKLGTTIEAAYKEIISMAVEGGGEWKDGQSHTTDRTVKVKVIYYTGGFSVGYVKGE